MELEIKIKNGELDLISSGVILIESDQPTVFTLTDDGPPMDIVIKFENDETDPKKTTRSVHPIPGQNAFEAIFTNYNSVFGSFSKEPWLIANTFNRELFLRYLITGYGDSNVKRFEYSFYLGQEVKNG